MQRTQADPINIVEALAVLLCCQLAGEAIVSLARFALPFIAFPGPVVGMALLFGYLSLRGGAGENLETTSATILRNLSLLFVPATVGIVEQTGLIAAYGPLLLAAILLSTTLTLLVTVGVFLGVAKWMAIADEL